MASQIAMNLGTATSPQLDDLTKGSDVSMFAQEDNRAKRAAEKIVASV